MDGWMDGWMEASKHNVRLYAQYDGTPFLRSDHPQRLWIHTDTTQWC
jgi:hypothetical protein